MVHKVKNNWDYLRSPTPCKIAGFCFWESLFSEIQNFSVTSRPYKITKLGIPPKYISIL